MQNVSACMVSLLVFYLCSSIGDLVAFVIVSHSILYELPAHLGVCRLQTPHIVGIAFCFIVIRVGMQKGRTGPKHQLPISTVPVPSRLQPCVTNPFAAQPMTTHLSYQSRTSVIHGVRSYEAADTQL